MSMVQKMEPLVKVCNFFNFYQSDKFVYLVCLNSNYDQLCDYVMIVNQDKDGQIGVDLVLSTYDSPSDAINVFEVLFNSPPNGQGSRKSDIRFGLKYEKLNDKISCCVKQGSGNCTNKLDIKCKA